MDIIKDVFLIFCIYNGMFSVHIRIALMRQL